jgi:hypothetical protein
MKLSEVTYLTENVVSKYQKGIDKAKTLKDLIAFISEWEGLADDSLVVAKSMTPAQFRVFKKCVAMERAGKYSGIKNSDIVGPILMPEVMLRASMAEQKYGVPFGTAVIRLMEAKEKIGA